MEETELWWVEPIVWKQEFSSHFNLETFPNLSDITHFSSASKGKNMKIF